MASMALLCSIFLVLALSISSSANADNATTLYQILEEYDLPVGLLPKGVTSYEFDNSTGKFTVHLNKTCTFELESYELKYKTTIKGVIAKDKITKLRGIQVKVIILWLSIVEVIRDEDELEFSVGIASANFPVSDFEGSPSCGCGFDCNDNVSLRKNMINGLPVISSSSRT